MLEEIDEIVRDQVALLLPTYISEQLQAELMDHRKQLDEVQKALHNSFVSTIQLLRMRAREVLLTSFGVWSMPG